MKLRANSRLALTAYGVVVLAFIYVPLAVVAVNSFNSDRTFGWPPPGFTMKWWSSALQASGPRDALLTSVKAGLGATAIALLLGTLLARALTRYDFFGKNAISLLVVLPIALPGIVTGIALLSAFQRVGIELSLMTLVVAHATFCVVIVFNNVGARLRRLQGNLEEASADLGADGLQTFRYVTFPLMRSALLAGALLAFALSFDEIIVTTFTAGVGYQTLPIWFADNFSRPNAIPVVNVVATFVVVVSIIPVYTAQRLIDDPHGTAETAA